ncbi:MAG: HEPN domain-containing protein [Candidatus Eisenbacteria bacterium]|nr:HEPN domain-containing protein [Candidatus Eisenbacteria bacterium]
MCAGRALRSMHDPIDEGRRWLDQAENDLAFARHALKGDFYHQVCFVAQQCVAKALKAVLYAKGARNVIGHSAVGLLDRLIPDYPELESLRHQAAELDLYYIPSRYPNGLVEGPPMEFSLASRRNARLRPPRRRWPPSSRWCPISVPWTGSRCTDPRSHCCARIIMNPVSAHAAGAHESEWEGLLHRTALTGRKVRRMITRRRSRRRSPAERPFRAGAPVRRAPGWPSPP